jgi:MFS family permease
MTAVSLQSIQRKGAQIIGPALGGFFLAGFGVAGSFFIRAASFLVVMGSVALVRATNPATARSRETPLRAMLDGIGYVRAQPVIGGLIVMEAAISIFGSYSTMMVIFARQVFETGPEGLGLLQSAAGFGSVAGSLILASMGDVRRKGLMLLITGVGYGTTLLAFSFTPWYAAAIPLLAIAGGFDIIFGAIRQTIIQYITREDMLGRVMSLAAISQRGLGTFGGFQAGALTSALGSVQLATAIGAAISIAVLVGVTARVPLIRNFTGTSASTARVPRAAAVSLD